MHTVEALDSLILFRQKPDSLLRRLMATEEAVRVAAQGELVALAVENGWQGDLWRCCIARELVSSENPFSLTWERHSGGQDTLEALALADMKLFFELLNAPPEGRAWPLLRNFRHESRRTADCASFLAFSGELAAAGSPEGLLDRLTAFYQTRGVGLLGMGQVFRARRTGDGAELVSVEDRPPVRLADLVGYRQQKDLLIRNTEAFLRGKGSNNVLLYGDAGTGKSTSIQALVNEYADQGLRLIELYKEQYDLIPDILRQVKGRNYRFLLFLDDLSFEENETSYRPSWRAVRRRRRKTCGSAPPPTAAIWCGRCGATAAMWSTTATFTAPTPWRKSCLWPAASACRSSTRPPLSRNTSRSSPRFRKRRGRTSRRNSSGPQPPPGRSAAVPDGRPGSSWTSWSIELVRCNCEALSVLISVYLHVFGE